MAAAGRPSKILMEWFLSNEQQKDKMRHTVKLKEIQK
jgi:hypothetical protein